MFALDRAVLKRDCLAVALAFDRGSARSFDSDGRMHVKSCRISKANVCPYFGREIPNYQGLGLDGNRLYMLYRHPEELSKAADSFRNSQLLMLHVPVNANDAKITVTVGTVGNVAFDGTYLVADQLTVWTKEGINLIETEEAAELSSSYRYRADMTPGVTPDGVAYDGVMRDIKGNHVALVAEGRAGPDVAVSDSLPVEMKMKRPNLVEHLIKIGACKADVDKVALDAKLEEMTAKDMDVESDEEDDPENPGKKRKKMNPGKGEAAKAGGALASDEQIAIAVDAKIKASGLLTKEDAEKLANDAAAKARVEAIESVTALHAAREAVKPLVGVVAMDSAEAVYKFALEKEGVAVDGIHPSAFAALVKERVALKNAAAQKPSLSVALDTASTVSAAIPGLARFG